MDFRQLRTFLSVAETGSISKSSRALHRVQPALSRQIKQLEAELQTSLFVRNARGMTLTAEGLIFRKGVERIFEQLEETVRAVRQETELDDKISLGMPPSLVDLLANQLNRSFAESHANTRLRLVGGMSGFVSDWLLKRSIDVGIYYETPVDQQIMEIPILDEPLYLVTFDNAADGGIGEPVKLAEVQKASLISPSRDHAIRQKIEAVAEDEGIVLKIESETDSLGVQKRLMWESDCAAILPFPAFYDELTKGTAQARPIVRPEIRLTLNVGFLYEREATRTTLGLIRCLVAEIQNMSRRSEWAPRISSTIDETLGTPPD